MIPVKSVCNQFDWTCVTKWPFLCLVREMILWNLTKWAIFSSLSVSSSTSPLVVDDFKNLASTKLSSALLFYRNNELTLDKLYKNDQRTISTGHCCPGQHFMRLWLPHTWTTHNWLVLFFTKIFTTNFRMHIINFIGDWWLDTKWTILVVYNCRGKGHCQRLWKDKGR